MYLIKALQLAILALSLSSCASITYGKRTVGNAKKLTVGMSQAEVTDILGSPEATSHNGAGLVWHWEIIETKRLVASGVPFLATFNANNRLSGWGVNTDAQTAARLAPRPQPAMVFPNPAPSNASGFCPINNMGQQIGPCTPTLDTCQAQLGAFGGQCSFQR